LLSQHEAHGSVQPVLTEVEQAAVPSSPHAEHFGSIDVASERTEAGEIKKPKKKPSEFFGAKKGK